jgi:mono/diheme cytochrome c family protein
MNLTRLNIVLGVLLVIAAAFAVAMDVDHTQPNVEFLPDMKRSPAFDTYAANPVFPNGRTLQRPVQGTISRGDLPLYYEATKEDAARAGEELQNPFASNDAAAGSNDTKPVAKKESVSTENNKPADQTDKPASRPDPRARLNASIQRGAKVYGVFCVSCHGPSGAGDGPVAKRGFPPPPPLTTGKSAQMKDGQLFHILTYGQGSMSPMVAQLTRDRRWDVINYVRSLQEGAKQNLKQAATQSDAVPETDPESNQPSTAEEGK